LWYVDGEPFELADYPYTESGRSSPASTPFKPALLTRKQLPE
jgi:hypothetical protein